MTKEELRKKGFSSVEELEEKGYTVKQMFEELGFSTKGGEHDESVKWALTELWLRRQLEVSGVNEEVIQSLRDRVQYLQMELFGATRDLK